MPTMAISEHIDSQGFHLWGSSRNLFHNNSARHEDRMQNFWNQVESFPWVSESCMLQNLKPTQAHLNPGGRVLVLAAHWQCSSGSFKAILRMAHIDQDWVQGFANHHESIKQNLEKHRIKILSGECQQWPSQSILIYMDFTCEAAHGHCFTTIRQDMKTGCKISETRLNHSHGFQSHAWCKIWNQCKHISIPEGESWFWPHADNAAVAPSKPFWRWPTLTKTESTVLLIIMNQSNGTWRNTESKFWVENANNGHLRAHWFTWISPVRQLTELVSRQFGKTWRKDAEFLKPGWIISNSVRVMHDANLKPLQAHFNPRRRVLVLAAHWQCSSGSF